MIQPLRLPGDPGRDLPEDDTPLLDWWSGIYDHVFVALHPYCTAPMEDPEDVNWPVYLATASRRRWAEVAACLGPIRFSDFARATVAAGGEAAGEAAGEAPDEVTAARLRQAVSRLGLAFPWQNSPSPSVLPALTAAFSATGADTAYLWSESRDQSAALPLNELISLRPVTQLDWDPSALRAGNGEILAVARTGWCWTLVAMTGMARRATVIDRVLDGFWAGPATAAEWIGQPGSYRPPSGWLE